MSLHCSGNRRACPLAAGIAFYSKTSHAGASVRYTLGMRVEKDSNTIAIAILRIVVGLFFTILGQYKVFGTQFTLHGGFEGFIKGFIQSGAYPFMVPVLKFILAHCATFVAFSVAYGEFLIGLSLLIGVLSRVASVFGFLLMISMWLSGGYPGPHAAFWMYWGASIDWSVFAVCFAVLILGRPEERWSLRHLVHRVPTVSAAA